MALLTNQDKALSLQLCIFRLSEVSGTLQLLGCAWLLWSLGTAAMDELTGAELHERSLV